MNIYLLRHGETDWNKEGRLQGHTDIPLNSTGRRQICNAAEVLADLPEPIDLILSSPLVRAYESAQIVADRLSYKKENIVVEPLLIERGFGLGEGLTVAERKDKFPDGIFPEMESYEDLIERAHSVFDKIVETYEGRENILAVSHGAILTAVLTAVTNGEIAYGGKKVLFDQGSIHLVRYVNGKIEIREGIVDKEKGMV